ncbi:MAG: DUF1559 domain-containing protein [Planctomycetaceae bacterium]|nr:DUF1559 domain-containing protein [Planctomycetaceae bacterium]
MCFALPAIQQAREAERRAAVKRNLKQVGEALRAYHERTEVWGQLPSSPLPQPSE